MNVGDRFQLRDCPDHTGIITRMTGSEFRVAWDTPDRKRGQPRERGVFSYSQAYLFVPEGSSEVRVVEDPRLDIPGELLRRYGISEA